MSKKSLFIIVHEQEVIDEAEYLASSIKALREIKDIKEHREFISLNGNPEQLLPDLPSKKDYRILLCGSRIDVCIPKQRSALEKAGYDVEIYYPASIF